MPYNKDSIGTILTILQKEYEGEENRSKQVETKAQVMLAVTGALASALMLLFRALVDSKKDITIETDIYFLSASLLFLFASMICFLLVFRIMKFEKLDNNALIGDKALKCEEDALKYHLAHDYNKCIETNEINCNSKTRLIKIGSFLIFISMVLFIVVFGHFACNIITKERKEKMAKDNSTSGNNSANTTQTPARAERTPVVKESNNEGKPSPGIGTKPIERSGQ